MTKSKFLYTCPICGSHAIYHDYKKETMKCFRCGYWWMARNSDIILPAEGLEELQEGGPVCVL